MEVAARPSKLPLLHIPRACSASNGGPYGLRKRSPISGPTSPSSSRSEGASTLLLQHIRPLFALHPALHLPVPDSEHLSWALRYIGDPSQGPPPAAAELVAALALRKDVGATQRQAKRDVNRSIFQHPRPWKIEILQKRDRGVIAQVEYSAGSRSMPLFGWARNMLSKKTDEPASNRELAEFFTYFWLRCEVVFPDAITRDLEEFYQG